MRSSASKKKRERERQDTVVWLICVVQNKINGYNVLFKNFICTLVFSSAEKRDVFMHISMRKHVKISLVM